MGKKKRITIKLIAIILSVIMLSSIAPVQAFALMGNALQSDTSSTEQQEIQDEVQPEVLYEIEEKRSEYTKVYKKSDDSLTAYISSVPLHHLQNRKWVDINNALVQTQRDGNSVFTNTDNPLDVTLPQTLSQENGVSLRNGAYTLTFTMDGIAPSEATLIQGSDADTNSSDSPALPDELKVKSETAVYDEILPQTDLEYSIMAKSVKENIVIETPQAAREIYTFRMTASSALSANLSSDGSVCFFAPDGQEIFHLPAPFMQDAADVISKDIAVSLSEQENGAYVLTYRPQQEWLQSAERQYPVVLDPVVVLGEEIWFTACTVGTEAPDENFQSSVADLVANGLLADTETGEIVPVEAFAETYVQFYMDQIEILTEDITPIDVQFVLAGAGLNLAVYEVLSPFNPSTVTYNTKPPYASDPIDYYTGIEDVSDVQSVHFNITKPFCQWLSGEKTHYGLAVYGYDNTQPASAIFLTHEINVGGAFLVIDFVEASGYSDRFDYHTQDIDRAGTSYVNDFTQRLLIQRDDIALSGNIMPVNISFLYNPALFLKADKAVRLFAALDEEMEPLPAVYGNGWLTNYNRCLFIDSFWDIWDGFVCYADENGNIIRFTLTEQDGATVFVEENADVFGDHGYTITGAEDIPTDCETSGLEYIKLHTPNGEIEQFDVNGRLIKIYKEKYPAQSVDIAYVSNMENDVNFYAIDYITDGAGRKFDFIYNADSGRLQNIQCFAADGTAIKAGSTSGNLKMTYSYDNSGNLTKVTFPDSGLAAYEYDALGRLTAAISRNMYKLTYTYDAFGRVRSISESAQDISTLSGYTVGNAITITPDGPKQVTFSDTSGNFETLQFDKYGRTALVTDRRGNYVDNTSGIQRTMSKNLLANQSFEENLTGWECDSTDTPPVTEAYAHSGAKSVKLDAASSSCNSLLQAVTAAGSGAYTFSAYIKAGSGFSVEEKLVMQCAALDTEGNFVAESIRNVAATSAEFERYSVVLNVPENAASIVVGIASGSDTGEFYVDSMQLEKGSGFGTYNLLHNNGFSETTEGTVNNWASASPYTCNTQTVNTLPCDTVCFPASKNAAYSLSQTVEINGQAGDILTFGGWMKADVVSNDSDCRLAQLLPDTTNFLGARFAGVVLTYDYEAEEDGETVTKTETVRKSIQNFISDWQFASDSVILKGDCTEVTFAFEYTKHPEAVSVAMPCLSLEKMPAYEEEEILPTDPESGETAETPDLCVCGEACEYGDGCPCTCTSAEDCDCPECNGCVCSDCTRLGCTCRCESEDVCDCPQCKKMFDITYDEFGNLLSLSISGYSADELLTMLTARTFSANGNYITSSTNENGGTVTYNYNEQNGVLNSETDARGNVTEYSYNAMGALTQVKTPVSGLAKEALGLVTPSAMVTNYTYLNDRVVTISHNDFAYYIDYDRWNNVDRVYSNALSAATGSLASTSMAQYTYGTGVNHSRLDSVRYGNGDTVHYRYDEYNRVIGVSYDGGTTDRFQYGYDALGNVVSIFDNETLQLCLYNESSVEVYKDGSLLYYTGTDADGNTFEYSGGTVIYTERTNGTRDPETGITGSKTEIRSGTSVVDLLKATDAFGRTQQTTSILRSAEATEDASFAAAVTDYTYKTLNSGTAAGQVDALQTRVTYGTSMAAENTVKSYGFAYDYDANGNITYEYAVGENGVRTVRYRYTYDEANQIVRVDDNVQGKTYTYQYDKGGNRVSEKMYPYTLSNTLGTMEKETKLGYNFWVWKDRISSYDGQTVKYDSAGNPTSYGSKTYTWEGKFLTEVQDADGSKTQFEYDANGFRTQKRQYQADGTLEYCVDYVWLNGKLVQQNMVYHLKITIQGTERYVNLPFNTKFIYNDSEQPLGCIINGEATYMFIRNLQGDIIALADAEGTILVEYSYDPWGKVQVSYPNDNEGEGEDEQLKLLTAVICPLTYRGYNYDFTTGLYYLQSRYYNPEWGRFLNVDDTSILLSTQGETHNANLFAYCNNNPVNNVDYDGRFTIKLSLAELDVWLGSLWLTLKFLNQYGFRDLTQQDLALYDYNFDSCGIFLTKIAFYNSRSKRYTVIKLMFGELAAWKRCFDYEDQQRAQFNNKVAENLMEHSVGTTPNLGEVWTEAVFPSSTPNQAAYNIAGDIIILGVGHAFLAATGIKRTYISEYQKLKDKGYDLMVVFSEIKTTTSKTSVFSTVFSLSPFKNYIKVVGVKG